MTEPIKALVTTDCKSKLEPEPVPNQEPKPELGATRVERKRAPKSAKQVQTFRAKCLTKRSQNILKKHVEKIKADTTLYEELKRQILHECLLGSSSPESDPMPDPRPEPKSWVSESDTLRPQPKTRPELPSVEYDDPDSEPEPEPEPEHIYRQPMQRVRHDANASAKLSGATARTRPPAIVKTAISIFRD